jgi:hypothetical protein
VILGIDDSSLSSLHLVAGHVQSQLHNLGLQRDVASARRETHKC